MRKCIMESLPSADVGQHAIHPLSSSGTWRLMLVLHGSINLAETCSTQTAMDPFLLLLCAVCLGFAGHLNTCRPHHGPPSTGPATGRYRLDHGHLADRTTQPTRPPTRVPIGPHQDQQTELEAGRPTGRLRQDRTGNWTTDGTTNRAARHPLN